MKKLIKFILSIFIIFWFLAIGPAAGLASGALLLWIGFNLVTALDTLGILSDNNSYAVYAAGLVSWVVLTSQFYGALYWIGKRIFVGPVRKGEISSETEITFLNFRETVFLLFGVFMFFLGWMLPWYGMPALLGNSTLENSDFWAALRLLTTLAVPFLTLKFGNRLKASKTDSQ